MEDMIALASCNGMGSNGLVSPVAGGDCKKNSMIIWWVLHLQILQVGIMQ